MRLRGPSIAGGQSDLLSAKTCKHLHNSSSYPALQPPRCSSASLTTHLVTYGSQRATSFQPQSVSRVPRMLPVAQAAAAADTAGATELDTEDEEDAWEHEHVNAVGVTHPKWDPGSAFSATLRMLEWPRLCEMVADHAVTQAGRAACLRLGVPPTQEESEALLRLTRACTTLEYDWATVLDFGGINTSEGERALRRAAKGGACSASQLRAVASIIVGGEKIRKQVLVAIRENSDGSGRNNPLSPMMPYVNKLKPQPALVRDIIAAIDDESNVMDAASDTLRQCRLRVKSLVTRLNNLLKGYGGEVTERSGRVCVALPAGGKLPPASMLLGTSAGGASVYVEPPAAVPLNNELAAARGEAFAAEDAVLFTLTGRLMGVQTEVEETYRAIVLLDVLAAKVKFGLWTNGVLPAFVPWNQIFHERGGQAARRRQAAAAGMQGPQAQYGAVDEDAAAGPRYAVRLRGLRHPLLLGTYLKEKSKLERDLRKAGVDIEEVMSGDGSSVIGRKLGSGRSSGLSKRRESLLRAYGLDQAPNKKRAADAAIQGMIEAFKSLRPPVPLDLAVKPHTSVVVITGPNTGGKTATMKALGLCVLMARAGLAVPSEAPALLPAFSNVLADIGDEQSLTANLSTFSGHLARIQALRAEADGKSLVLLDELGTGTDPVEGAALGVALLRRMVEGGLGGGALTIATTHHSIMTGLKFDDRQERFENASVEFDSVALAPTYKLLWGIPGKSNALNIAARLGLDEDVIESARQRLDTSVSVADATITELEELRSTMQGEETAIWAVNQEVSALSEAAEVLKEDVERLQQNLTEAKDQALFEVWLAAKERLKRFRDSKRAKGVVTPANSTGQRPSSPGDVAQEMEALARQITKGEVAKRSLEAPQPVQGAVTGIVAANQITLDDLVDARVEMSDLLDDLSQKSQMQQQQVQEERAAFDDAVETFEALTSQAAQAAQAAALEAQQRQEEARRQREEQTRLEALERRAQEESEYERLVSQFETASTRVVDRSRDADTQSMHQSKSVDNAPDDLDGAVGELESLMSMFEAQQQRPAPVPAKQTRPTAMQHEAPQAKGPASQEDDLDALIAQLEETSVVALPSGTQHQSTGRQRQGPGGGRGRGGGNRGRGRGQRGGKQQ